MILNVVSLSRLTLQNSGAAYVRCLLQFSLLSCVSIRHKRSYNIGMAPWYVLAIIVCEGHIFTNCLKAEHCYGINWDKCKSQEMHSFFLKGGFIALISTQHTSRVTKLFHCNNQFTNVFRQFNMDNCGAARFQQWKTRYTINKKHCSLLMGL